VKASEIIRKLKKQGGWYIEEHGAEHDLWAHKDYHSKPYISLSRNWNKEISTGQAEAFKKAMREVEASRKAMK